MKTRFVGLRATAIVALSPWVLSGCARGPENEYGSSRGMSINGTAVFASMLRDEGHEVRAAIRLTDELGEWAEGLVRFATYPGPPARDEAKWYHDWLADDPDRWLIYVIRDFDATSEYWRAVLAELPASEDPEHRTEAEEARDNAADWVDRLPRKATEPADSTDWFKVDVAWNPPRVVKRLRGPWAVGIDAEAARLTAHEPLHETKEHVLLVGDDKPLIMEKSVGTDGRLLVIANGSFLLNEALVNAARRPLARKVVEWASNSPSRIALVEGWSVIGGPKGPPSLWDLIKRVMGLRWAAVQFGVAGVLAALARAPRLGRPKPDPASDAERPVTHALALGALLARAGSASEAHDLLDHYRRWRHPRTREISAAPARPIARRGEDSAGPTTPKRDDSNG